MRKLPKKIILLAALAAIICSQTGCTTVQPWQRATLADYTMRADRDPMDSGLIEHVYFSREMGFGGEGIGSAGCGCN